MARALTHVESGKGEAILSKLRGLKRNASVIGITGAPGAGKSTLTDGLIRLCRDSGEKVAVLAIDPSSPFSGGAILGDRIRMLGHVRDTGVYVRSAASRGALGGLAQAASGMLAVLEAFGFDRIFVETVGVGQSEVDIAQIADSVMLVLTPAGGDGIQAFKAGIMEIADLLVVNKSDLPEADRFARNLKGTLELGHSAHDPSWQPAVIKTVAHKGEGLSNVLDMLNTHRTHLGTEGLHARRLRRARFEVASSLRTWAETLSWQASEDLLLPVIEGKRSPLEVAQALVQMIDKHR